MEEDNSEDAEKSSEDTEEIQFLITRSRSYVKLECGSCDNCINLSRGHI